MKNLLKKWIFIAQFYFQDSGFRIRIRVQPGDLNPDPQHWLFFLDIKVCVLHAALPLAALHTGQAGGEDSSLLPQGGGPVHPPSTDQAGQLVRYPELP